MLFGGIDRSWLFADSQSGFVAAGLGLLDILVPFAWWQTLAMASVVVSLVLLIIFWNSYLIVGGVIDVLILVALIFTDWAPE